MRLSLKLATHGHPVLIRNRSSLLERDVGDRGFKNVRVARGCTISLNVILCKEFMPAIAEFDGTHIVGRSIIKGRHNAWPTA